MAYYLAMGDYKRALQALPTLRGGDISPAAEANLRGIAELVSGNAERALPHFDQALKADPALLDAQFNRGIALLKLKRHDEAISAFRAVAEAKDARASALAAYHAALAADQGGFTAAAERWLEQAIAGDASLDSAWLYLGVVREKQQKFGPAGEAYREYLTRHPDSLVAMLRFGVSAHRAGFPDTARKHLQHVVSLAPSSPEAAEARKFLVMWD